MANNFDPNKVKLGREHNSVFLVCDKLSLKKSGLDNNLICRYNVQIKDFLSKLPGINSKNIYAILNKADNLAELLDMSEDTLAEVLGSRQSAGELHSALHGDIQIPEAEDKTAPKQKPFKRFKSRK